jgi:hypothetical protein
VQAYSRRLSVFIAALLCGLCVYTVVHALYGSPALGVVVLIAWGVTLCGRLGMEAR